MKTTQSTLSGGASVLASLGEDSRGGSRGRSPHRFPLLVVLMFVATLARAATNDLSGLLQKGLFEEEANRNLDAASAVYETLVKQFDKDRQIGATAIFRLGEVYRKQGKTNEAAAQYERIVRDFAEQTTLVTLSQQNLAGLKPASVINANSIFTTDQLVLRHAIAATKQGIADLKEKIASYQALPEINRVDSLCKLFADDAVLGTDCNEAVEINKRLRRLLLDGVTTNHPTILKLQKKLETLENEIGASAKKRILSLPLTIASLEQQLQMLEEREAAARENKEATESVMTEPDVNQLKKLSRAELLQVLPTLVPDQLLTKLLEQLQTTQTKQAEASQDLGPNSLEIKKLVAVQELLDKQIDERVAGILKAIELRSSASGASKPTGTVSTVRDEEEAEIHRLQAMIRNSPDLINGAPSSEAPLIAAARAGRVRVVKFLLDNGANINVVSQGKTALHNAVQFGNRAMVELLLQRGADVKAKDGTGGTPLHEAAQNGFLSIVEVLLQHKADLNARNSKANYELSPLHLAVKNGHAALVGFLLANGDDVNRKASGWTPLHGAAASGHDAMVTSLLKAGADVNAADNDGDTPLMDAAERGHLLSVKALLAAKADPEVVDQKGRTALSYAADSGHVQIVQTLLDAGAKPDLGKLDLPLLVAVRGQKHQIADLLLSRGAGPNLESKSSVQISGDQSFSGGRQPSGSGKSVFGPYQPLHAAVARKDVAMVTLLLKWKANPNIKQNSTWFTPVSPLLFSVLDNEAMLQAFLEAGADANARSSVNDTPALVSAAAFGQQEAVRLLLKYKAKVNDADGEKRTALLFAAERGDLEMTKLLLTHQPDVNAPNAVCNSPLHGAVWVGHKEIVALLLEHGANPNVRGGSGLTPLDYTKPGSNARSANKRTDEVWRELAELLRKHGALDDLPDFTRVRITRQGVDRPFVVFYKAAKLTNHFSLLETVMSFYARGPGIVNDKAFWPAKDLGFPDLSRVIIRRPSQTPGGKAQEIRIGLLNASNVVDCARDVPVEFGDVIEIPERVHALNEAPMDPVREMERTFMEANRATLPERQLRGVSGMETNAVMLTIRAQEAARKADAQRLACLQKTVQLIVAGERASFTVDSWKEGFLSQALAKPQARAVLRSSSDLARVEVTRQDAKTGKPVILIVDAANILQPGDDLWLRGGDVIEVPDKP